MPDCRDLRPVWRAVYDLIAPPDVLLKSMQHLTKSDRMPERRVTSQKSI